MGLLDQTPQAILGAAVRALEANGEEVNEGSLYHATKNRGINRDQVKDFLEKAERGKKRRPYPGYQGKSL